MAYTYPVAQGVYSAARAPRPKSYEYGTPSWEPRDGSERMLSILRSVGMQDAGARVRSARVAGQNTGDPALAAYGGLNALLGGQGDVARGLNTAGAGLARDSMTRAWQERMARLQREWEMERQRSANDSALWGNLLGVAGTVGGAYL